MHEPFPPHPQPTVTGLPAHWQPLADLNFTAIDFETANQQRASACAVGIAVVRGGQVVHTQEWLIRPPTGLDFHWRNIQVHGIRPAQVEDAPEWPEVWEQIAAVIDRDALVAHNAPFDRGVWRATTEMSRLRAVEPEFFCTLQLSRRLLDLPSNRLPNVVEALGIEDFSHHEAGADALACARVGIEMAHRYNLETVDRFRR